MTHIESGGRLTGPTFISRCSIPDIQPNTKIVAVCGVNDWSRSNQDSSRGQASPQQSGWFFSDFYLLHHLFKEVSRDQIWLTCVEPETAVTKYGEYIHGDSAEGAMSAPRVVLDKDILPEVSDIRTIHPRDLLERFLSTLQQSCAEAREQDRPVLVLIIAPVSSDTFSMVIGGEGDDDDLPRLSMEAFKRAMGTQNFNKRLCLLTTACYGGGWAIDPDLNITTMLAASKHSDSLSWPCSGTANMRLCGSPYASHIADSLLRLTVNGFGTKDYSNITQLPTYGGLLNIICDAIHKADPRSATTPGSHSLHQPMFSAEIDDWTMAYSSRTGFPLNKF